ncbi:T9SS type A sorting domain-containing protein [Algoriphagus marincola]|uniref:T9SS type A sorting domain-containing protein n=1 Tax=Algoriphagus marincola TaxID=264027 RepID=A0ABS7N484_9BACT|nr:T9SS type A sorting domain-containing protein [Algoriphagus marincola]MBY5951139.1 T9SS type A sorting domain-containing protein [Algoriphagus marincola]
MSAFGVMCLTCAVLYAQETGAFRTVSTGNFNNLTIWEIFDGSTWAAASFLPNQNHDIYIDQTHTLTLTQNEAVKSLFINAEAGAGQKLNLNGFNLDVYGSLQGFDGAAPGTPNRAWNSINWIGDSPTSTITFRGNSRVTIPLNTWSAQSDRSRYSVIFDPGPGQTLIIEEAFKALSFIIRSGTVLQRLDTSVTPGNCPTFSFNTETTVFGPGPFGELIIEPGAQLISECNDGILFRSGSISALLFILQNGAELILEGETPEIEAANFQLNGTIIHRGGSSTKTFLASTYPDAAIPNAIRNLELQGSEDLILPSELFILGDLRQSGTGEITATSSHLYFVGNGDQQIENFLLNSQNMSLNKPAGDLTIEADLNVTETLYLQSGSLDLNGNTLTVNSSGIGGINYSGGTWKNANSFIYSNLPTTLTATNGTFPFEDVANGGERLVQLLGTTAGGDLEITFTEFEGADFNAGFQDTDGTDILYRLFSYFQFSGFNPSPNLLELRISADQLIVDDVDDLRIVGTGYAAPGNNISGLDPVRLWARREVPINDFSGINFTIGSFRTLSILPIEFFDFEASWKESAPEIRWKVRDEKAGQFEVYRSENPKETWNLLGAVESDPEKQGRYNWQDVTAKKFKTYFYRIKHVEETTDLISWSTTVRLNPINSIPENGIIYPNPYTTGPLHLKLPAEIDPKTAEIKVFHKNGTSLIQESLDSPQLISDLKRLRPGLYFIQINSSEIQLNFRWIRK